MVIFHRFSSIQADDGRRTLAQFGAVPKRTDARNSRFDKRAFDPKFPIKQDARLFERQKAASSHTSSLS